MDYGEWEVPAMQLENVLDASLGGYLEKRLRENLPLDRKSRRYLRLTTNGDIELVFKAFKQREKSTSPLEKHIITFDTSAMLIGKEFRTSIRLPWVCKESNPNCCNINKQTSFKEKLSVTEDVKRLLTVVSKRVILQVEPDKYDQIVPDMYRLAEDFLNPVRHVKHAYRLPRMVSKLEMCESELFEESLSNECPIGSFLNVNFEFEAKQMPLIPSYLIQNMLGVMQKNGLEKRHTERSLPHWPSVHIQNNGLNKLRLSCQDEDFHPLELYKLQNNPELNEPQKFLGHRTRPIKAKWKISDQIVGRLNWNPFTEMNISGNSELIETMKHIPLELKSFDLSLKRFSSSRIDLISKIPFDLRLNATMDPEPLVSSQQVNTCGSPSIIESKDKRETTYLEDVSNKRIITDSKRSFINPDLANIIAAKRTKLRASSSHNTTFLPITSSDSTPNQTTNSNITFQSSDKRLHYPENKIVTFNAQYINKNYKLISFLHKKRISVLEIELGDHSDVLLSPSSCLILQNITYIYQKQNDSFSTLQTMQSLQYKYKNIVILLLYPQKLLASDPNVAYKTQLLLNCQNGITTHLVEETQLELIATWITAYCGSNASNWQQIDNITPEKELLQLFDINPFAIQSILNLAPLEEFLSLSCGKRALLYGKFLTRYQLARIDDFSTMRWSDC
ncbi:unnamed protein product [Kluyveromyces dobzhanskii CBS 2104]|uniref:WGS project CCBQ000000000 data, contig 00102 n=1 Tax=Kluyveromyces dobzhanskii CBS 2104 TaxID=1427455 RepID=A0A0A8L429_9SACH|nr:unnamed protein product [Kluyveromyces dobzhanskii CBS 2104]